VRRLLGIEIRGEPHIDWSMTVYLRIPDFHAHHNKGKAFRYVFVGPEGTWSFLSIVDGKDLWRLQLVDLDESRLQNADIPALVRRFMGRDIASPSRTGISGSANAPWPTASWTRACFSPAMPPMRIRRTAALG
jgi:hypothetical protein